MHAGVYTGQRKCIFEEIGLAVKKRPGSKNWNDVAAIVKQALVGVVRPIETLDENKNVVSVMGEDGKQLVRAITEDDIDKLGPYCAEIACLTD